MTTSETHTVEDAKEAAVDAAEAYRQAGEPPRIETDWLAQRFLTALDGIEAAVRAEERGRYAALSTAVREYRAASASLDAAIDAAIHARPGDAVHPNARRLVQAEHALIEAALAADQPIAGEVKP